MDFVAVPYDPASHKKALLEFLSKVYPPDVVARREKVIDWIEERHPYRDRAPLRYVIMDGDRVAATQGHLPAQFLVNGRLTQARFTHDLLVDPAYRGKGLAKIIVGNALAQGEFMPGGMWMTGPCHQIHLRCGFEDAQRLVTRTLILDSGAFADRKHWSGLKRVAGKTVIDVIRARALRRARRFSGSQGQPYRVVEIDEFPPEMDEVWKRMLDGYGVAMFRDSTYLNWRYNSHPVLDYRIQLAERGGQPVGYLVWRSPPGGDADNRAVIVDFLVERGDTETLEYLTAYPIVEAADAGVEVLSVMTTQKWAAGAFRRFGFLPRGESQTWVVGHWEEHISPAWITDHEPWHMCGGDSDGDMWTGSV
jgi:GNAT superfamily N-acetyltransferase